MTTKEKTERQKRRRYWVALFGTLLSSVEVEIQLHVTALVHNSATPSQFGASMLSTLQHAHPRAWMYGAQSIGAPVNLSDATIATRQTIEAQADYLAGFVADLRKADPRYVNPPEFMLPALQPTFIGEQPGEMALTPTLSEEEQFEQEYQYWRENTIATRAQLYAERVRGTANTGMVGNLPETTLIYWRLGPNEDHCPDCPVLAKGGPYIPKTLPTVPGAGMTECLVNCKCELEIEGESFAF